MSRVRVFAAPAGWFRRRRERSLGSYDIAALPLYQVALWPDGWELTGDGGVIIRDTHEIAEARRWYTLAERNGAQRGWRASSVQTARTMQMHGVGVPRGLVDLVGRRFRTEQAASVAVRLIDAEWVDHRRRMLGQDSVGLCSLQAQLWSGSRHADVADGDRLSGLLQHLLSLCVAEGLIPRLAYRVNLRVDDGYGMRRWRCRVIADADLRPATAESVAEVVAVALIPWNRQVIHDGKAWRILSVNVASNHRL